MFAAGIALVAAGTAAFVIGDLEKTDSNATNISLVAAGITAETLGSLSAGLAGVYSNRSRWITQESTNTNTQ